MSDAAIFAISLGVTVLGLVISWGLYSRRGAGAALRGAAWSLVPLAAAMTGVTEFFVDLAFSPVKWAGVALTGVAVLLYLTSGMMLGRRSGGAGRPAAEGGRKGAAPKAKTGKGEVGQGAGGALDPDLMEIEQILKNRGIR